MLLLLTVFKVNGQDCSELRNESAVRQDELISTASQKLKTRGVKEVDEAEEAMKKDLLVKLSEKIIIEVESGSTSFIQEEGSALVQLFSSETKISSNTKLGNLKFDFCFDEKFKTLFGRCKLNKAGLSESILKDCITRLIALNSEIEGLTRNSSVVNVRPLTMKYEQISRDYKTALFINHHIQTTEWNLLIADYNKAMSKINTSEEILDLKSSINQAAEYISRDEYDDAIAILKALRKEHKQNDEVEYQLQKAYDQYLNFVRVQASKLVQQHDYPAAVALVDNYCAVAICNADAKELRQEIRVGYFVEMVELFTGAMQAKNDAKSAEFHADLVRLSDVDPKRYKELDERYLAYKINRLMEKARLESDRRNYWEAYSLLRTSELVYGVDNGELKSLKDQLFRKMVRQEIAEEKKSRPYLNSFEFGLEGFANEIPLEVARTYRPQAIALGVSAGLYFKYAHGPVNSKKGFAVRSDIIGLRARYISFPDDFELRENGETSNSGHLFEAGADGVLMRIFHYNLSAVYNESSRLLELSGMSASFGLRIPIHSLAFGIDGRYFSNLNDYAAINAVFYIHGKLDFHRDYTRADKRHVRAKLREY